jgi:S1-C subfamily serine protease
MVAFAAMLMGSLGACQQRPLYEPEKISYPSAVGEAPKLATIENGILRALRNQNWQVDKLGEIEIIATKRWGNHVASVKVEYDKRAFGIKYQTSRNLRAQAVKESGNRKIVIHHRYNSYVLRLKLEIENQLRLPPRLAVSESRTRPVPIIPRRNNLAPKIRSAGTGFYVSRNGHIITNYHVIRACDEYKVWTAHSGGKKADLIGSDKKADLALLATTQFPLDIATLRSGRSVRLGESVTVFGYPLTGTLSSDGVVTTGNVSALSGLNDDSGSLQISAGVQKGNSGGPLFDESGNVIGIVYSKLNAILLARYTGDIPQNVNFAIKLRPLEHFLNAHNVDYVTRKSSKTLKTEDLVERARDFTVRVECWR